MSYVGFDKLKGELAGRKGVTSPGGLAHYIGEKKYGEKKMVEASAFGRKHPQSKPMLSGLAGMKRKKGK